jgi:hypothetical protein
MAGITLSHLPTDCTLRKKFAVALSKGPNRVGFSLTLTQGQKEAQFSKYSAFYLEFRTMEKVHKPSDSKYSNFYLVSNPWIN